MISKDTGHSAAQIALAWVQVSAGVTSSLLGVSRLAQLAENIAALDILLSEQHRAALDFVSAPEPRMLHSLFTPKMRQQAVFGGSSVRSYSEA